MGTPNCQAYDHRSFPIHSWNISHRNLNEIGCFNNLISAVFNVRCNSVHILYPMSKWNRKDLPSKAVATGHACISFTVHAWSLAQAYASDYPKQWSLRGVWQLHPRLWFPHTPTSGMSFGLKYLRFKLEHPASKNRLSNDFSLDITYSLFLN